MKVHQSVAIVPNCNRNRLNEHIKALNNDNIRVLSVAAAGELSSPNAATWILLCEYEGVEYQAVPSP